MEKEPEEDQLQPGENRVNLHRWLKLGRAAWPVLAILVAGYYLAVFPVDLQKFPDSWEAVYSYTALDGLISFPTHAMYLLALRHIVLLSCLFVALLTYIQVGLADSEYALVALLTASLLVLLPLPFTFGASGSDLPYDRPYDRIFETFGLLLFFLFFFMLVWFYFVFPSGKLTPGWLRWLVAILAVVVAALFSLPGIPVLAADWLWPVAMLMFLFALGEGIVVQISRYRAMSGAAQKRQIRLVILSLILLPVMLLVSSRLNGTGLVVLVNLHMQVLALALLPASLAISMLRYGLWDVRLSPRQAKSYRLLAGGLVIASLAGVFWGNNVSQSRAYPALDFEPLAQIDRQLPVIVDTDMAADDWMAILFLLQRPDVQVKAITVTGTGEAHCEPGVRNALGLVALAGHDPIPVACGRETPLIGVEEFPQAWRDGVDQMLGLKLPEGSNPHSSGDAVDLLLSAAEASPEKVVLLTLGPLTNVAEAIQREPAFLDNIRQIVIMGGALQVPGNVFYSGVGIDNKDAEWNVFVDPLAAKMVIESGAPVTLVSLDATNHVPVDLDFFRQLESNRRTPEAQFVYQVLSSKLDMILPGVYYFWDPLAAALAVDESIGYVKEGLVRVVAEPGVHSGATRLVANGVPVRYAKSADNDRFVYEFLRALNQQ